MRFDKIAEAVPGSELEFFHWGRRLHKGERSKSGNPDSFFFYYTLIKRLLQDSVILWAQARRISGRLNNC